MIKGILYSIGAIFGGIFNWLGRWGWKGYVGAIVLVIVVLVSISVLTRGAGPEVAAQDTTKNVEVASVAALSQGGASLSVAGIVQSQTEATVRTESSGEVTRLNYVLGDTVAAGAIVAELENASQRAAVLSAEGSVQAATASANVSQTTLAGAKSSVVATLLAAYGAVEKAVHTDIDPMFSNPESAQPIFNIQSSDSQSKINVENARLQLGPILVREQERAATLSVADNLTAELIKTQAEVRLVRDYLDAAIKTLNAGVASEGVSETTIATYQATAAAARSTITGILSSISSAQQALTTAEQNSATGGTSVSASGAALTQAQGALAAARANLEKTIIRAPISGTINSLSLTRGDYVSLGSPVLTVANNGALEVITYITANDATRIAVGGKAALEGSITGTITRIAPALDPLTKKIEVRIGLPANAPGLINGQSVVITFAKPASVAPQAQGGPITIPISALKIGADQIVVFTLDTESRLVAHPVTLGALMGDRVEIATGITTDMEIVVDARGLQPGEKVLLAQ